MLQAGREPPKPPTIGRYLGQLVVRHAHVRVPPPVRRVDRQLRQHGAHRGAERRRGQALGFRRAHQRQACGGGRPHVATCGWLSDDPSTTSASNCESPHMQLLQ